MPLSCGQLPRVAAHSRGTWQPWLHTHERPQSPHLEEAALRVAIDIRRSSSRSLARTSWLQSLNPFPFEGGRATSDSTHFGLLLVSNEDTVNPGTGFDTHPHQDMEIVTWVPEGALVHADHPRHVRCGATDVGNGRHYRVPVSSRPNGHRRPDGVCGNARRFLPPLKKQVTLEQNIHNHRYPAKQTT
ncbi:pirin family protein [Streptomyces sp. 900116325]